VDGYLHHYDVQGVKMSANTNTKVDIYFIGNNVLQLLNGTAILKAKDPLSGEYTENAVIVSSGSSDTLARRRTQLFEEAEDDTSPNWETRQVSYTVMCFQPPSTYTIMS
jgi:hypothetical protein